MSKERKEKRNKELELSIRYYTRARSYNANIIILAYNTYYLLALRKRLVYTKIRNITSTKSNKRNKPLKILAIIR